MEKVFLRKKSMSRLYDTSWEKFYKKRGQIQSKVRDIVKDSLPFLKKNNCKKILDIGCGTGRHSIFLAKNGFTVTGTDPSKTGLDIAKKKAKKLGLNIKFKSGKKEKIEFQDNYFDAVICINVLSHSLFSNIKSSIREINRVLRKDGILVAGDISDKCSDIAKGEEIEPNTFINMHGHMDSESPHHFFTEKEILDLFKNFKVLKLYYSKEGILNGQINLILKKAGVA